MINLNELKSKAIDFFKDKNHLLESHILVFLFSYFTIATDLAFIESSESVYIFIPIIIVLLVRYARLCYGQLSYKSLTFIPILYIFYLMGSYFMNASLNLANESFVFRSFEGFWQYNFLPHLVLISLSSLVFRYIFAERLSQDEDRPRRRSREEVSLKSKDAKVIIFSQFLTASMLSGELFRERFLVNTLFPVAGKTLLLNMFGLAIYTLTFYLILESLSYSFFRAIKQVIRNQTSYQLSLSSSMLLATIINYFVQQGISEYWTWYDSNVVSGATIFQITVLTALFMLIYTIFNRYLLSTVINIGLGFTFAVVNAIKFELRHEPLLIGDFVWLRDIQFFLAYINRDMVLVALVVLFVVILFLVYARNRFLSGSIMSLKQRIATSLGIMVLALASFVTVSSVENKKIAEGIPVLSSLYNNFSKPWLGVNASAKFQSLTFVWLKQLTATMMEQPEGYSEVAIDNLYQKYMARAVEINENRSATLSDQTIIYILSESSSDPQRINGITLNQDVIPNIRELQQETTSGLMKADGYGGGTANMEFQSLIGLPMYNFNEMISILYTEVAPKMSIMPSISDTFDEENRIAIHLNNASNYSRSAIYQKLNFDTFVATSGGTHEPIDTSLLGNNYSDEASYNNILELLDENKNQFFSVMTIQNHSPWGVTNLEDISGTGVNFSAEENQALTNFSRLLYETDQSTKVFLDKLSELDKDITVVFYGDHLPALYPLELFTNQPELQYQTDYFIWSNRENTKLKNIDLINSSDFPALLLEHTDSKVSAYYALLTDVLHKASVNQSELSEEQEEIVNDLKLLQYDLTQGKKYIQNYEDFFDH